MSLKTWFIQRAMRRKLKSDFARVAAQPMTVHPGMAGGSAPAYGMRFKGISKRDGKPVDGAAVFAPSQGLFMTAVVTEGGKLPEIVLTDKSVKIIAKAVAVPKTAKPKAPESPPEKKPDNKFNL